MSPENRLPEGDTGALNTLPLQLETRLPVDFPGRLRNQFEPRPRAIGRSTSEIENVRRRLAEISTPSASGTANPLVFSPERLTRVLSLSPEQRQQQFLGNIDGLRHLAGDARHIPKSRLAHVGGIILDVIRFPINPIDNTRRAKESVKGFLRKFPGAKNLQVLQPIPEDATMSLSKDQKKAENEIATSLMQMRRDALPYDGKNLLTRLVVNWYAKKNINMSAKKALSWFAIGNFPAVGFLISSFKLYIPNAIAPLYNKNYLRAIKTIGLTATDFAANIAQSVKAGLMILDARELLVGSRGFLGVLAGLPALLINNWQVIAPYPFILAYNPLFIQGRLDQNDYRKYARHMEGIGELLWSKPTPGNPQVVSGAEHMLSDYGKSHPSNDLHQNVVQLNTLMKREYTALLERMADETKAIAALQEELGTMSEEHHARQSHKLERQITELSLRNKAHSARLLYIENLYLLMQETGHL